VARIGTIVHYKVAENVIRPAIVVQIHSPDCVQLQVFLDGGPEGTNDASIPNGPTTGECARGMAWRTSVVRGNGIGEWEYDMSDEAQPEDGATEHEEPTSKPTGIYNK
jgi:hypothetical protein